ncbi:MAG TPA: ATP-dependent RNA helicase HrpA [Tepidisphaeraceae bacterium]|nr:ATP-dependent RNA helicase HrpA [Tepidisphaeraceae bacterium]
MITHDVESLPALISQCMLRDQRHFRARLATIRHRMAQNKPFDRTLTQLLQNIEQSSKDLAQRKINIPAIAYPPDLPVVERREEIACAIATNQVIVLCGETGSGKTTQLPKICLELGRGIVGMIGHTQPRRIAARSVATRFAQELQRPLGEIVGYQVRFSEKIGRASSIKLMTDGILLAETQHDRLLEQYDTIILDEAHERSLNIDLLIGYLKQLLPKRPDLKLIITSATIDPQRFSKHFNNAPVINVSGRTYPVEVRYRPLHAIDEDDQDIEMEQAILRCIDELWQSHGPGDTLVFLSGERDIRETAEALRKHHPKQTEILPLYARLSVEEQMRVFAPHNRQRIVLATNVAETSLTVPGIRYVIDPGLARISRYAPRTKVQRLPIEPISRASADQRAGRCGRVGPGVCVRLYAEDDYNRRPHFTDPEVLRTNLASAILQMNAMDLGDVRQFPFIDPPDSRAVRDGYETLHEIGAIDDQNRLTEIGKMLSKLPIDPRIGRMVLAGHDENVLEPVLIIAAALSVQDPRLRPIDKQADSDNAHKPFRDENSDFLGYLKLGDWFQENQRHLSGHKLRLLCKENFLSFIRMREWQEVHGQLREIASEMGLRHTAKPRAGGRSNLSAESIHRSLLTGLLSNVGMKGESFEYTGARGSKFSIFPGSSLFNRKPAWIMAAEIVETAKLYARTVAPVRPEWIERLGAHLLKRSYSDPYWQPHTGSVMGYEKVTFYGLPLIPRRGVHYGPIDPKISRQMFIQHALVDGDWYTNGQFFRHNRELIEQIQTIENKSRKRDLLVDTQAQFDFYDKRIPAGVYSGSLFEKWRRQAEANAPKILFMNRRDLMNYNADIAWDQFPDNLTVDGAVLPLDYHLEPGSAEDGVTVTIPLELLNRIHSEPFEWLVPGLLKEKILSLIRSLPKSLRTAFIPAGDYAAAALTAIRAQGGSLRSALASYLGKQSGLTISAGHFQLDTLPDHLRMNFRVVDSHGHQLAMARELSELRQKLAASTQANLAETPAREFTRDGITHWDFGDLPEQVRLVRNGIELIAYPAIAQGERGVSLRLMETPQAAAAVNRAGLRQLFMLQLPGEMKALGRSLDLDRASVQYCTIGDPDELRQEVIAAAVDAVFFLNRNPIRTRDEFIQRADEAWRSLGSTAEEYAEIAGQILESHHVMTLKLDQSFPPMLQSAVGEIKAHLSALVPKAFMVSTPPQWLRHLPRFVQAAEMRLTKLTDAGLSRDMRNAATISPLWKQYIERANEHRLRGIVDPELDQYRWMLEELRVSLFAQELGTSIPISEKRLEKQWALVQK